MKNQSSGANSISGMKSVDWDFRSSLVLKTKSPALSAHRKLMETVLESFAVVAVLSLAIYFRFYRLADNPGWYSDEGTILEIVKHLRNGSVQYMAINQSTLLAARLPIFPLIVKWVSDFSGFGIETLRRTTAALGVLDVMMLFLTLRKMLGSNGRWFSILAAFVLAILPKAVLYQRFGFSYNLLTPLILIAWFGGWQYLSHNNKYWLGVAALAIGLGGVSDLMMLSLGFPYFLMVLSRKWRDLLWSLPIMVLPMGIYAGIMLLTVPVAFIFDLRFIAFRMGAIPGFLQLPLMALNFGALLTWDAWILAGFIGLFLLWPIRLRRLTALYLLGPMILLGRTTGLVGFGFYYLSPLLPFISLGVAALIWKGTPYVFSFTRDTFMSFATKIGINTARWFPQRILAIIISLSFFMVVFAPIIVSLVLTNNQVSKGFETYLDEVLIDANSAREVLGVLNNKVNAEDLVIASPTLAWGINCHVADFQISLASEGIKTEHFPGDIPKDRFAYDPSLNSARYVVIDPIWRNWAAEAMPEVKEMITRVERWPLVYKSKSGKIEIYQNPVFK